MTRFAIIPARGGSKRIPKKNIRMFLGKPMIAWSIEACLQTKSIDRIIVSTDDEEIREIALKAGAEVPFLRPATLSGDDLGTMPPMRHAVEWLKDQGHQFSHVCSVYATAPFIRPTYIDEGFEKIRDSKYEYVFAATTYAYPIQRSLIKAKNGSITMKYPEYYYTRSQDLQESWHDAAQFYWGLKSSWLKEKPIFLSRSNFVPIPRKYVQDIDTLEDWEYAEAMAQKFVNNVN